MKPNVNVNDNVNVNVNKNKKINKKEILNTFEEFWKKYPRKINKKKCFILYIKLIKDHNMIMKWLDDYIKKRENEWVEKIYIPHATTWLNWERWKDDIENEIKLTDKEICEKQKEEYLKKLNLTS